MLGFRTVSVPFPGQRGGAAPGVGAEIKHQRLEAQEIRGESVLSIGGSSRLIVQED